MDFAVKSAPEPLVKVCALLPVVVMSISNCDSSSTKLPSPSVVSIVMSSPSLTPPGPDEFNTMLNCSLSLLVAASFIKSFVNLITK